MNIAALKSIVTPANLMRVKKVTHEYKLTAARHHAQRRQQEQQRRKECSRERMEAAAEERRHYEQELCLSLGLGINALSLFLIRNYEPILSHPSRRLIWLQLYKPFNHYPFP